VVRLATRRAPVLAVPPTRIGRFGGLNKLLPSDLGGCRFRFTAQPCADHRCGANRREALHGWRDARTDVLEASAVQPTERLPE
jgi:hypothetical protein